MQARAAALGFDAILWRGGHDLFGQRLPPMDGPAPQWLEVDVTRFPLDHDLVRAHPDLFAIRRSGDFDGPVDPRHPMPAAGEALARLRAPEAADLLAGPIGARLAEWADAGIGGFRLLRPERIGPEMLAAIAARIADKNVTLLAGPFGDDRAAGARLAAAGLDYGITSFAWWDLRAPWLIEEHAALAGAVPLLAELRSDQPVPDEDEHAIGRLLLSASVSASGIVVPEAVLARCADAPAMVARAVATVKRAAEYRGTMRRLSGSSDPVTALLRADAEDPRAAARALLALINTTRDPQPAPAAGTLAQRAGSALDLSHADLSPLAPGEVRLVEAVPGRPVLCPVVKSGAVRAAKSPRLVVEQVTPCVAGGDFAVKRVVGDVVRVGADIFADGHEQLAAELRWRACDGKAWKRVRMTQHPNDRWTAEFPLDRLGPHEFVVEGWLDRFGGFRRDFARKLEAGVAQPVDHAEGRALIEQAVARCKGKVRAGLEAQLARLDTVDTEADSAAVLLDEALAALMDAADDRPHALAAPPQRVDAERLAARFSSWYELFPRSMSDDGARHGTFDDVIAHLPRVRDMGFDTLYFPPIHPIGKTNRKGPNNTLTPGPDDPGSPYAIGSAEGGHDAIHPELGGFGDFDRLVAAARDHGLEIALDFAIQASPDHPWLSEHPGWFAWRPDGSMKYAENPPKKYQDIVNVDFYGPDAVPELWTALRDVILLWIDHGVKVFRVDNPHTKPLPFWEWMIADVRARHPDAIFLAEAFTRPTMMYRLAKIGFSQSYTYFTWRDRKQELIDYVTELTTTAPKEFYRPHFFVNTPDINPLFLQTSGRPGFRIRAVLAATLSGLFGVYSGFELCEAAPLPGKEEYLDSEKYEVRPRDWDAPGNIIADITLLNRLRRAHPALQTHLNTRFYIAHDENILWYGKASEDGSEKIMVMVNLDPHAAHECDFEIPLWEFGLPDDGGIAVEDLVEGHRFDWYGKVQHIRIAPDQPYRIWRLSLPGDGA